MSFLDRLLRKRFNPTLDWGAFGPPIPDFDISKMSFGSLRFGDAFDAAAFLGRPDRFTWTQDKYCELLYASRGFQIDYDDNRFAYLAFFIGPENYLPKHLILEFSKPRLRGCSPDGIQLSGDMDRAMLARLFGPPDSADAEQQETILCYIHHTVAMEFEMGPKTGRLKRWNLYPK